MLLGDRAILVQVHHSQLLHVVVAPSGAMGRRTLVTTECCVHVFRYSWLHLGYTPRGGPAEQVGMPGWPNVPLVTLPGPIGVFKSERYIEPSVTS